MSPTFIKVSIALTVVLVATPTIAQSNRYGEGPGDIVAVRDVPYQNAILVGEPGRPVLVNPKAIIGDLAAFTGDLNSDSVWPLDDQEAADIFGAAGSAVRANLNAMDGLATVGGETSSLSRADLSSSTSGAGVGGVVSGAVDGATSQIRSLLSSPFGRGGQ